MFYIMLVLQKQKITIFRYSERHHHNLNRYRPKRSSRGFITRLPLWLAVLAIGFGLFKIIDQVHSAQRASALEAAAQRRATQSSIQMTLSSINNQNPGITFSVSVTNLSDDTSFSLGSHQAMPAASVGKLISAAFYYHKVERGQSSLGQQLDGVNASQLIKAMINQSDDNAWLTLNDFLGHSSMTGYAHSIGLASYEADSNTISTADVARLLGQLYTGRLLNAEHTRQLLGYMQNTNYEDFISRALPRGDVIYHKVGLADDNVNDAAIIAHSGRAVVLVIFTDGHGTQNWSDRALMMQQLAKKVIADYL
jgi:beta-lactamase class A